jgi:hypothetical protein
MKDLIKKILKEETEKVLEIPGLSFFPDGIDGLKNFIQKKKITRWSLDDNFDLGGYKGDLTWLEGLVSISGYLDLEGKTIESLDNLQSVGGYLDLRNTPIKFLSNLQSVGDYLNLEETPIESLGNLRTVGASLDLNKTPIKSLGNLQSVGGYLDIRGTQIESFGNLKSVRLRLYLNSYLSTKTNEEIKSMVDVGGLIVRL